MKSIDRRGFLKTGLAASAAGIAPVNILKAGPSPNNKVNVACVGVGGQGGGEANLLARADNVNLVGMCDVDEAWYKSRGGGRHSSLRGIKFWRDYRVMFDEIGKEIDAIYTATPDHVRFAVCMFAMRRDKHVYAQKPLCHTVQEARLLAEEARKRDVVTQMGNQANSTEHTAMVRDWVQGGCIGEVREVVAYCRKNYGTKVAPVKGCTVPKTLAWDLFLNRAEEIPFSTSYLNREWIRFSHFAGVCGDMGSHLLDHPYYALDLPAPTSVTAEVPEPPPAGWLPKAAVITWEFAAREVRRPGVEANMPPVTMKYYLGPDIPYPRLKHLEESNRTWYKEGGSVVIGERASIMSGNSFDPAVIIPEASMAATKKPPEVAYRRKANRHWRNTGNQGRDQWGNIENHLQNWVLAIQGEDKTTSHFEHAGPLSEIIVLGDVAAMHPGKRLLWDAENMRITNDEEANKSPFIRRLAPRDDMNWI